MGELWIGLAPLLLALSTAATTLAIGRTTGLVRLVANAARVGAAGVLAGMLLMVVMADGRWTLSNPRQVSVGLALATTVIYLVLAWRLGTDAAGPAVDLIALVLSVVAVMEVLFAEQPSALALTAPVVPIQWSLVLLGAGGLLVAGGAGATLGLRSLFVRPRTFPGQGLSPQEGPWADLHALLYHATALALVTLGAGVMLGVWWNWRNLGTLTSGDRREQWTAIVWLVAAASLLARRTGRHWDRWTAGLAFLAAVLAAWILLAGMQWHFA